jgi:hypothetical protein
MLRSASAAAIALLAVTALHAQVCSPTFNAPVLRNTGSTLPTPRLWAAADFNGDGFQDLAVGGVDANGRIMIFYGSLVGLANSPGNNISTAPLIALHARDVNNDGRPDLILADANQVTVRLNDGAGGFTSAGSFSSNVGAVGVGDLTGDGNPDVVVASRTQSIINVYRGQGNGAFVFHSFQTSPGALGGTAVLADVNGDGKLDVIVGGTFMGASSGSSAIRTFFNNGTGGLDFPTSAPTVAAPNGIDCFRVADFNGDGRADLAYGLYSAVGLYTLLGNGVTTADGGFTNGGPSYTTSVGVIDDLVVGDLNGDGAPDLVAMAGSGAITMHTWTNSGAGIFTRSIDTTGTTTFGLTAGIGDFNGDGRPDIAFTGGTPATFSVAMNQTVLPASITTQPPQLASTQAGTPIPISVGITGTASAFRWHRNGIPLVDGPGVSGSTTAALTLTPAAVDDGSVYFCRVSTTCGGPLTSGFTSLHIVPTPPAPHCTADLGQQGGIPGPDGFLDNNDFIAFIDAFFSHTGCP